MPDLPLLIPFGGLRIAVDCRDNGMREELSRTFAHFQPAEPGTVVGHIRVERDRHGYHVSADCKLPDWGGFLTDRSMWGAFQLVKNAMLNRVAELRAELLWLHSGAVARGPLAILFPGSSGRGKSTLVSEMVFNGWLYLSDEVAPVDCAAGTVLPFPQTITRRDRAGKQVLDTSKLVKSAVTLDPRSICRDTPRVAACVFPRYSARARTQMVPCDRPDAALNIAANCVNLFVRSSADCRSVGELVASVPCFHLVFNDGKAAADLVDTWFRRSRPDPGVRGQPSEIRRHPNDDRNDMLVAESARSDR